MSERAAKVRVARRFTRSIRVDSDLNDPAALNGYILTQSAVDALLLMARHRVATGHGAFTWTGPYGSGKSSLAVALGILLTSGRKRASDAFRSAKSADRNELLAAFRPTEKSWRVVPVVGRREAAEQLLAGAVSDADLGIKRQRGEGLANWISRIAKSIPAAGLVLIVDEMGKLLEHAAVEGGDVHIFQELAEASARSNGRLVVIGILHQAFDEYAHRLSRQARDEWQKVQGRFVDLPINLGGEEQIELIARAIEADGHVAETTPECQAVARSVRSGCKSPADLLERRLAACWPLHPLTAALLGPMSRRRFGQSQRSIFGFLTSAEPFGFQEFLRSSMTTFGPDQLWDYLRANLEPSILASPDGHRWSTAVDAIHRCDANGGTNEHLAVLKTIALLDLFKDRSGLRPDRELVSVVGASLSQRDVEKVLKELLAWSVIVYRKHSDSYAIYAGSDFDIEGAIIDARAKGVGLDFKHLAAQAALQPVLAKRHYDLTGALRWFEVEIAPLHEAEERASAYKPAPGSAGLFLVLVSANSESKAVARRIVGSAAGLSEHLIIPGWTRDSYRLRELGADLAALEYVRHHRPELESDPIARREVDARISRISGELNDRLSEALEYVDWKGPDNADISDVRGLTGPAALSVLASRLADWRYQKAPCLRNELVNRTRPSSNAAAATRNLLRAMVENRGIERLGIAGFPAEAGLFSSILDVTGLYRQADDGSYAFLKPCDQAEHRLHYIWEAADRLLRASDRGCSFADIFGEWAKPPYGVRDGLHAILGVAYLLSRADTTAVYLDEVFRPQLDSFFVDRLLQDFSGVRLKAVELSDVDVRLVNFLARSLEADEEIEPSALSVARVLVRQIRALPLWTLRTSMLSQHALALRNLAKDASDPNQLLFVDLPRQLSGTRGAGLGALIVAALNELRQAYPKMLEDVAHTLLSELRSSKSEKSIYELGQRASRVKGLTGNFRLDALATRLMQFTGDLSEIESIASLAANKPPRDWVDRDIDAARIELAALAQQFLRAEGFAHLKGRKDGRLAMSLYLSDPAFPAPSVTHIELSSHERAQAEELASQISAFLGEKNVNSTVALGAIARLGISLSKASDVHLQEYEEQR